ncbi:MAG: TetR/AcrR family transcriptional regulator [Spirochaetaceae bacterium]|nr:TetR/AcrR family transcriptional regulator [Spirochaetaceae bacterium]MBR4826215.1 TetR/AcrR family transcriptional regulator [Spirochaetaceae bacterium]
MAIIVEHDKRKHTILDKALDVFVDEGYEDATFQKIADRCGITRTTLYLYFRNKREIFISSIRQLTTNIELSLLDVMHDNKLTSDEKLKQVLHQILDACRENPKLFTVILNYLLQVQKTGKNPGTMVRRRIVRLRHLLCNILIEGINKGELGITVSDISTTDEMLYAMIESSIFRLAILNQKDIKEMHAAIDLAIEGIKKK